MTGALNQSKTEHLALGEGRDVISSSRPTHFCLYMIIDTDQLERNQIETESSLQLFLLLLFLGAILLYAGLMWSIFFIW